MASGILMLIKLIDRALKGIQFRFWRFKLSHSINQLGAGANVMSISCVSGGESILIGEGFFCRKGLWLEAFPQHGGSISIGNAVSVGTDFHIGSIYGIVIEDGVLIGSHSSIIDHNHGEFDGCSDPLAVAPVNRALSGKGKIVIQKYSWIGDKVTILGGVTVGAGSVIAAGSVVNTDIPMMCVAGGVPAKIIKRFINGKWAKE